ncbi:hypothetical protein KV47_02430 [Staphylococcus haemolyticus]|uniref:hypothetical protein n=1 Tax=Staphylococcus haemolyticus TaxID=1283 RepID=UPI0004452D71|nr:hypothetical protein [Staphylococcus haemolyticus]EZI40296.1 hypothetical protein BW32_00081 [Staphylococcus haemolyticus]OCX38190.1 hypothetical protein KV47_02430 [Staphylococcus haemolyticus]
MAKLKVDFVIEGTAYIDAEDETESEETRVMNLATDNPDEFDRRLDINKVKNVSLISDGWK